MFIVLCGTTFIHTFSYREYDIHVLHVHRFLKEMANKSESGIFSTKIFSPEHSIMYVKNLTFQFVLLELPSHLIYAPLPSTHQPRPTGEYKWQVCYLLDSLLLPLLHLSSLIEIGM